MASASPARTAVTPGSVHADAWRRRLAAIPARTPADVFGLAAGDSLVVAVAHPDDETLAMGATLARLARAGVEVHVVAMTRGEAALDHVGVHVDALADRRREELLAATACLDVTSAMSLDLPDGGLGAHAAEVGRVVADTVERYDARCVATLWRDDPHPDHRAVSRAATSAARAARVVAYELGLWSTHWTDPVQVHADVVLLDRDEQSGRAKQAALGCYRSQTQALAPDLEAILPPSVLAWPHEYVVRR